MGRTHKKRDQGFPPVMDAVCVLNIALLLKYERPCVDYSICCAKTSRYSSALMEAFQLCKLPTPQAIMQFYTTDLLAIGSGAGNKLDD